MAFTVSKQLLLRKMSMRGPRSICRLLCIRLLLCGVHLHPVAFLTAWKVPFSCSASAGRLVAHGTSSWH